MNVVLLHNQCWHKQLFTSRYGRNTARSSSDFRGGFLLCTEGRADTAVSHSHHLRFNVVLQEESEQIIGWVTNIGQCEHFTDIGIYVRFCQPVGAHMKTFI